MADYTDLKARCLACFQDQDYSPDGPLVWVWHVHRGVLLEPLWQPIESWIDWIIANKSAHETPVRLEWLRPARGKVPTGVEKAWAKYAKAWAKYVKARAEREKAWAEYVKARAEREKAWAEREKARAESEKALAESDKVWAEYKKAVAESVVLSELHATELPGCPWDGRTLVFEADAARKKEDT